MKQGGGAEVESNLEQLDLFSVLYRRSTLCTKLTHTAHCKVGYIDFVHV